MSEVFDPECYTAIDHTDTSPGLYVTEATYLKLLALYREIVPAVPCYVCGREAKGTKAKVRGTGEPVCMACYDSALDSN